LGIDSILMMTVILAGVWGGFIAALAAVVRQERGGRKE
jgi:hypothetical protein